MSEISAEHPYWVGNSDKKYPYLVGNWDKTPLLSGQLRQEHPHTKHPYWLGNSDKTPLQSKLLRFKNTLMSETRFKILLWVETDSKPVKHPYRVDNSGKTPYGIKDIYKMHSKGSSKKHKQIKH